MKKKRILLIGAGGHCKSCIDVIEKENKFKIEGLVDLKEKLQQKILGYKIMATDEDLPELVKEYKYFLITLGQLKSAKKRIERFEYVKKLGGEFPVIISPSAYISKHASIDEGTIVMHQSFINADAQIGKNCIINTEAIIEHDAQIGNHCHISTGSVVNGECKIGSGTFFGSNSVLVNNITITENTIIGAGSVVIKSITQSGTYVGNPAKRI